MDFSLNGEGFIIFASLFGSIGTIFAKEYAKKLNPFVITAWQMFLGSSLLLFFGVPQMSPGAIEFTTKGWVLLIKFQ